MFGWMSNHRVLLACGRKPSCGTVRIEFRLCFAHLWMSDECCESMLCDRLPSKLDKVLSHLWTLQRRKANRKPIQYLTLQQGRNGFVNESVTSLGKSFAPFIDGSFASHNRPIALKRRPHQTPPMTPCNSPVKPKVKASGDSGFSPNITKNH